MTPGRVILLGGGGHAAVVGESARARGWSVDGFLDDDAVPGSQMAGVDLACLGTIADLARLITAGEGRTRYHVAVGDAEARRRLTEAAQQALAAADAAALPAAIIDPRASVSPSAAIEPGVFIGPGAVVNARSRLGNGVIVNSGAIIEHDCVVGAYTHVAPRAVLAGNVTVGEACLVGVGASVHPGRCIGDGAVLGAGAVVVSDIPDGACVVGVPARPLV